MALLLMKCARVRVCNIQKRTRSAGKMAKTMLQNGYFMRASAEEKRQDNIMFKLIPYLMRKSWQIAL